MGSIYEDIEKTNLLSKKEDEKNKLQLTKQEILSNILKLKLDLESLSLKFDQICFDNIVMLDTIIKNFEYLTKI